MSITDAQPAPSTPPTQAALAPPPGGGRQGLRPPEGAVRCATIAPTISAPGTPPASEPHELSHAKATVAEILAWQQARTGYGAVTRTLIAEAALPQYAAVLHRDVAHQLSSKELAALPAAIDALAQAGLDAAGVTRALRAIQTRNPQDWRRAFWTAILRRANARYNDPQRYGLSPTERDPERLARYSPRAPQQPAAR
jgi:hypothetical protein